MAPTLAYERPVHVEDRFQPPALRAGLSVGGTVLAVVAVTLFAVVRPLVGTSAAAWLMTGPTVGLVAIVACAALHGRTVLYADRLEVSLHWAGLPVWRRRVPWAAVTGVDVRRRPSRLGGFQVWGRAPGQISVMYGGDGVAIHVHDHVDLLVGSADPERLAAAIGSAIDGARGPTSLMDPT